MEKKLFFAFSLYLFFFTPLTIFADTHRVCAPKGYSVITINGIFNSEVDAIKNKDKLKNKFRETYNGEPLIFDYLYNPTHLAGTNDLIDVIQQGLLEQKSDYDLVEMLNDTSEKIKTQKILLVAHSQGNFYANNLYDIVTSQKDGIPKESIGVYGVGTPASRVGGNGRYLTSDTDNIIATMAARHLKILPPNVHISLKKEDGNGHSFSDVYLKYQGERIVSDIQGALGKLKENSKQNKDIPCIPSPELSTLHKAWGMALSVADPAATAVKNGLIASYKTGAYIRDLAGNAGANLGNFINTFARNLSANLAESLPDGSTLTTIFPDNIPEASAGEIPTSESKKEMRQHAEDTQITSSDYDSSKEDTKVIAQKKTEPSQKSIRKSKTRSKPRTGNTATPQDEVSGSEPEDQTEPEPEEPDPEPEDESEHNAEPDEEPEPDPIPEEETEDIALSLSDLNANGISDSNESRVTVDANAFLTAGTYKFKNLVITGNAVLTLKGDEDSSNSFKGVKILAESLTVENGSKISADGQGYRDGPGFPPGANDFAGPSYAGMYGSATKPKDLGTGGTGNFRGGGAIWLVIDSALRNDGMISASGDLNSTGGSIYVETKNLSGDGTFAADGGGIYLGSSIHASGSGGRIAIYYDISSWQGNLKAKGGCGSYDGYSLTCVENGTIGLFDDTEHDLYASASWMFQKEDGPFFFNKIKIMNKAKVTAEEGTDIVAEDLILDEESAFMLSPGQSLNIAEIDIGGKSTLTLAEDVEIITDSISVSGGSVVTITPEHILALDIEDLIIEDGSSVSADGKGYLDGPGASDQGASYGGEGWGEVSTYGSESEPVDFGSGGVKNNRGGGAIRLMVRGTLANDGLISANGNPTSSGGSVYVTAKNLKGKGAFMANGGSIDFTTVTHGPGGGGRVAVYYETSSFTGTVDALGINAPAGRSKPGTTVFVQGVPEDSAEEPSEDPDPTALLADYTFNEIQADVTIDPLVEPVTLRFTARESVDWVSIIIESEDDGNIEKQFRSGSGCEDFTPACEKVWNGELSGGGNAPEGTYRVKVHIKNASGEEFFDYLSHKIVVLRAENIQPLSISVNEELKTPSDNASPVDSVESDETKDLTDTDVSEESSEKPADISSEQSQESVSTSGESAPDSYVPLSDPGVPEEPQPEQSPELSLPSIEISASDV